MTFPLPRLRLALLLALTLAFSAEAGRKNSLGRPAPDFKLGGLASADSVTLSALRGKVVFIDFWASWCVPCRQLMPRIAEIKMKYPQVEIIAVSVDNNRDKAVTFLRQVGSDLRAVHDEKQTVSEAYGVQRMPSSFVIDARGVLRFRHDGYGAKTLETVEREIQLLLNEAADSAD